MKIAVIRFSALGDIASIRPIVNSMKFKPTLITSIVGYEYYKDEFDDFIILENKKILTVFKLIMKLRKRKFDVIFDFQCNDRSRLITKFSNSEVFDNKDLDVPSMTNFEIFYAIANRKGLLNNIDEQNSFKKKFDNYIVLNCGSSIQWQSKRLPEDKWLEIIEILSVKYDMPFYFVGDSSEVKYLESIAKKINYEYTVLAGKTSLTQLKKVLSNAYLTVTTDSAAMHISATLGRPTIGLFGATNWKRSRPYGKWSTVTYDKNYFKDNEPLQVNTKEVNHSMYENISIEDSLVELENFLKV
ncbi:glycosyltransferase family 9 protein [Arcobacter sp. YIC-464]|uniref:glycosyltransferase family 9 protein n=1 Tax=Arcobacter sp. YIC-464 TaxID=3376631 RepID=UPI003C15D413